MPQQPGSFGAGCNTLIAASATLGEMPGPANSGRDALVKTPGDTMGLPLTVETLDSVPEAARSFYVQKEGGKFALDAEGIEDPTPLKTALQKERAEREKAERNASKYKDIDPEKYQQMLTAEQERQQRSHEEKGEWTKLKDQLLQQHDNEKKQITDRHTADLTAAEQKQQAMLRSLEQSMIEADATLAISAVDGNPTLLLPHIKARTRLIEEQGRFVARVVDDKGNVRIGDSNGNPMTIKQLVDELRADKNFGGAFAGDKARGTGARPSARPTQTGRDLTANEKISIGLESRMR
jgi:hypothetical protein